jgi:hypothetical protein
MQVRPSRANDYRQEASRLRQTAREIDNLRQRIELLDRASQYEMLAAAEPIDHRGSHRLRRRALSFD